MQVQILTPETELFNGEVERIKLPGSEDKGGLEILKGHAPLISSLKAGTVVLDHGNETSEYKIDGGFVEVLNNHIAILIDGVKEKAE